MAAQSNNAANKVKVTGFAALKNALMLNLVQAYRLPKHQPRRSG